MAMQFCDGFEQYADLADFRRSRWTTTSGGITGFSAGRHGGQRIDLHGANMDMHLNVVGDHAELIFGVAVNWTGASMQAHDIFQTFYLDSEQFVLSVNTSGELIAQRGGTQLDITSGLGLTNGGWYYIEARCVIDNTVGEYEVKVNGTTQLGPATGQDTQQSPTAKISKVVLRNQGTADPSYDDFYMLDATGLTNNDFLGDIIVETVFPMADGNRNDMTRVGGGLNNYEAVDDGSTPDDDTTYNHGNTVGDDELYDFDDLTGNGFQIDTVHAVGVCNHHRSANEGTRAVRALARSNVTEVEGESHGCSVTYRLDQHVYETDPDGGGAWDEAAVNAAEFGITIEV